MLADPSSNRMANCIAPAGHKLAGSSVLHLLAHRGGAHTITDWYAVIARDVVDKVASNDCRCSTPPSRPLLLQVQFLASCLVVGWLVCVESVCSNAVLTVQYGSRVSECVCVCGCVWVW